MACDAHSVERVPWSRSRLDLRHSVARLQGAIHIRFSPIKTREDGGVVGFFIWTGGRPKRSRTEAPVFDDDQQVLDADGAVVVVVAIAGRCTVVATT